MRRILVLPHALLDEISASFMDRRSFKVRSAATPDEALQIAASWIPALIIYGSELEGAAGGFSRRVRRTLELCETRLLMLTEQATGAASGDLARAEVDGHLLRPVDEAALLNAVGAILDVEVRRAPRLRCQLLARVEGVDSSRGQVRPMYANILGLSETGMLLEGEDRLRAGDVIMAQFVVPDRSLRVALRCMVVRADDLQLQYGCEFLDTTPVDRDAIREYVADQLARRARRGQRERRE